ncbi:MAG TPA: hypothetical protein VIH11_01590 [Gemmatimonadaceae bacterium]|nr:hypothetical protein [Gemmatimonadaceae bacterium]
MPVTARLSHRLHDALGEDAGGDLVTWMQTVDASRTELRELNELMFARIESLFRENDARLDARFAQVDTRFAQMERLIERQYGRLLGWSFGFWATALAALYAFTSGGR